MNSFVPERVSTKHILPGLEFPELHIINGFKNTLLKPESRLGFPSSWPSHPSLRVSGFLSSQDPRLRWNLLRFSQPLTSRILAQYRTDSMNSLVLSKNSCLSSKWFPATSELHPFDKFREGMSVGIGKLEGFGVEGFASRNAIH